MSDLASAVLVIDDNRRICSGLRRFLNSEGYRTKTAKCVSEAVQEIEHDDFDVLILDLNLPDINGLDALPMLKSRAKAEVVVLSGIVDVDLTARCMKAGAFYVLPKPPNLSNLMEVLAEAVEQAHDAAPVANASRSVEAPIASVASVRKDIVSIIRKRSPYVRMAWRLTEREALVLEGLVLGKTNGNLAKELDCSERGIEKHVTSVLIKTSTSCRTELVTMFWLQQHGDASPASS